MRYINSIFFHIQFQFMKYATQKTVSNLIIRSFSHIPRKHGWFIAPLRILQNRYKIRHFPNNLFSIKGCAANDEPKLRGSAEDDDRTSDWHERQADVTDRWNCYIEATTGTKFQGIIIDRRQQLCATMQHGFDRIVFLSITMIIVNDWLCLEY